MSAKPVKEYVIKVKECFNKKESELLNSNNYVNLYSEKIKEGDTWAFKTLIAGHIRCEIRLYAGRENNLLKINTNTLDHGMDNIGQYLDSSNQMIKKIKKEIEWLKENGLVEEILL